MAKILSEKKSTAGSPYVYYNVWATEVEDSRTADEVQLNIQASAHLASSQSYLGSGSAYTLTGYLQIQGNEYSISIKGKNDSWSGTTVHTTSVKTITIQNLESQIETLTNVKFRVARGNGSTSAAGYLASTSCSNISISIGHIAPSNIQMTMEEINPLLVGVSDNMIVEYLSQKRLTFTYELHDDAYLDRVGVYNDAKPYSSTTNPFILDLASITLTKNENNKIPLTPYVKDNLGQGLGILQNYDYIPYKPISITNTTTSAKRNGQTSGKVRLNVNGIYYNNIVGSIDQTSYKPIIKYKFWNINDDEPSTYAYTIPNENITISNGTFSVSDYEIGSAIETDVNHFNPDYAYRIKVQAEDNFTYTTSNEISIPKGVAIWTEYLDRVDFKKLTIAKQQIILNADYLKTISSIASGGTTTLSYDITKTGYTPIAISGISCSNSAINIFGMRIIDDTEAQVSVRNIYTSTSSNVGIRIYVAYIKE